MIGDGPGAAAPVTPPSPSAPIARVGYGGLTVGPVLAGVFLAGDCLPPGWLGLDFDCLEGEQRRRAAPMCAGESPNHPRPPAFIA